MLRGAEHLADGAHVPLPERELGAELGPPLRGQPVVLRPAVVLREAPLGGEPAAALQPVEGGVERAFFDQELLAAPLPDPGGDGIAVARAPGERLEDQEVEGALEKVERGGGGSHNDLMGKVPRSHKMSMGSRIPRRHPSPRSAVTGSTASARRAGSHDATSATHPTTSAVTPSVSGSVADTW